MSDDLTHYMESVSRLRAEVERLRAALLRLSKMHDLGDNAIGDGHYRGPCKCGWCEFARAALAKGEP